MKMIKSILLFFLLIIPFLEFGHTQGNEDRVTILMTYSKTVQIMKLLLNDSTMVEQTMFLNTRGILRGMEYDPVDRQIYWTENDPPAIKRSDINFENVTTVVSLSSDSRPYHLAIEKELRKLFYADYNEHQILSMDLTGSNLTTILNSTSVTYPYAIVIHSVKRQIIWSEVESDMKIISATYDGSNIRRIVNTSRECFGLAVDEEGDILYWSELHTRLIQSVTLDGSNRRVLYTHTQHLFDLFLLDTTLYFTAYKDYVYRISVDGRAAEGISDTWFTQSYGLYVLSDNASDCSLGVTYGVNCEKSCNSRHCVRSSTECDPQTGQCPDGCELTWRGEDCTTQCPAGTFGTFCTSCSTRHCQGESDCPADGTCSQGCQDGYVGDSCTRTDTNNSSVVLLVCAIAVAVVGTLLIVAVVLLCLYRHGRLQCLKPAAASVDNIQMDNMDGQQPANNAQQAVNVPRQADTSRNIYHVLELETRACAKDYKAIPSRHYQTSKQIMQNCFLQDAYSVFKK